MKKTYLAWIFTGNDYFQSIVPHFFLLKKLSENFEKVYLINLVNLKLFEDVRSVSSKLEMSEEDKNSLLLVVMLKFSSQKINQNFQIS